MNPEIPVFLSYPRPFNRKQEQFVISLADCLRSKGLEPRTIGVTDYNWDDPLGGIKELMEISAGLLTIALRRIQVISGVVKTAIDTDQQENCFSDQWLTSPYAQIEPAMAFQAGLPILVLREQGVLAHGILESPGEAWSGLQPVDMDKDPELFLNTPAWQESIGQWEESVRYIWAGRVEGKSTLLRKEKTR